MSVDHSRWILELFVVLLTVKGTAAGNCTILDKPNTGVPSFSPRLEKYETALLMLVGFCGFSVLLACFYKLLRKHVFLDANNFDTSFDAGGNVSTTLTAVTVASQYLWPADLLMCSVVTIHAGIASSLWFTTGVMVNQILYPVLSVKFKNIAPGAKTYVQLFHARFGKTTHAWYCLLALFINLAVFTAICATLRATVQAMTKDASIEFVLIIAAVLFGSYSFIGGLGTTFYVSYFNTVIITVILVFICTSVFFSSELSHLGLGDISGIYKTVSCLEGPKGNYDRSFLTFRSMDSFLWGMVGLFLAAAMILCDQASWQSRIAAKSKDGVIGFLIATAIWFSIPSALGISTGLAYLVMSEQNGTHLLTTEEIHMGLVTPVVIDTIFGKLGSYLLLTISTMAFMTTGSGEVMAVASIIVYDIYQVHINPFRPHIPKDHCKLCEKPLKQRDIQSETDKLTQHEKHCVCRHPDDCIHCSKDALNLRSDTAIPHCPLHTDLRAYQAMLFRYKSWCIIWVTICTIPIGLVILTANLSFNWVILYPIMMSTFIYPGVLFTVLWSKTSKNGVLAGSISGLVVVMITNLTMSSLLPGGIDNFFVTSVDITAIVASCAAGIFVTSLIIIVVSLIDDRKRTETERANVWIDTHNIDNPLHPWADRYMGEIPGLKRGERPTLKQLVDLSKKARVHAYVGSGAMLVIMILVIPITMVSFPTLSFDQFQGWVLFCVLWAAAMMGIAVILAPIQEFRQIYKRMRKNKTTSMMNGKDCEDTLRTSKNPVHFGLDTMPDTNNHSTDV